LKATLSGTAPVPTIGRRGFRIKNAVDANQDGLRSGKNSMIPKAKETRLIFPQTPDVNREPSSTDQDRRRSFGDRTMFATR